MELLPDLETLAKSSRPRPLRPSMNFVSSDVRLRRSLNRALTSTTLVSSLVLSKMLFFVELFSL